MIKELAGLQLPPATAVLRYSAKIKGEAFIRLGFYALFTAFKRLLRKTAFTRRQREVMALKDGMIRLKRDTERSIEANLTDYRENLKFQYLYKLIDAVAENLYETLFERFQAIDKDLAEMVDQIGQKGDDKRKTITALCDLEQRSAQTLEAIERLRDGIAELLQNALPA
jgi:Mg2+ and Co2+ transporter CorA